VIHKVERGTEIKIKFPFKERLMQRPRNATTVKRCHYKDECEMFDSWFLPVNKNLIEWFDSQVSHITLSKLLQTHTQI